MKTSVQDRRTDQTGEGAKAPSSLESWQLYVRASVNADLATLDRIASRCVAAEAAGEKICVWHQAAIEFGKLDRCQCGPCASLRAKAA